MVDRASKPMVICSADGVPIDVVQQNAKGHKKTIESGVLWALHQDTGRLLPYRENARAVIEDRDSWYCASLDQNPGTSSPSHDEPGRLESGPSGHDSHGQAKSAQANGGEAIGDVLTSLAAVIRQRRAEMPEGSYTTHLFERGAEKIRKKTGEEAVELILAADKADLTSEAADLIYHLLVLLEVEGITLDDLSAELRSR